MYVYCLTFVANHFRSSASALLNYITCLPFHFPSNVVTNMGWASPHRKGEKSMITYTGLFFNLLGCISQA